MAAPKGNKNGRGRKGRSGRKGAGRELMDATREFNLMYNKAEVQKLLADYRQFQADTLAKVKSKIKLSVRDIMLAKEILGNERLISQHYGKVVPDTLKLGSDLTNPLVIKTIIINKSDDRSGGNQSPPQAN